MILKYKGNGIFILQAHNIIPRDSYTKQFACFMSELLVGYIMETCDITKSDFAGYGNASDNVHVSVLTKQEKDDFVISMGLITDVNKVIDKCNDVFDYNEEIFLGITPEGLMEIQNTGEIYMDCEHAMYAVFKNKGMLKEGRILPLDYPFVEPAVREKKFQLYKTTKSLREALIVFNMIADDQKVLYSNQKGLYGISFHVYGEELKRYEAELMCETTPFKTKMEPFSAKMVQELLSLYS